MTILNDFQRVTRLPCCPVCGRPDWCLVSRDDPADPSRAVCARVESSRRWGDAGWFHQLRDVRGTQHDNVHRRVVTLGSKPRPDLAAVAYQYQESVGNADLQQLSSDLGVSMASLRRLCVGWTGWAWSFPMSDHTGSVRGIRLRKRNGAKSAIKGGREGLFIPTGLSCHDRLLICEGPTDTSAMLDLGFGAVGRPSCTGGTRLTIKLARRLGLREAVVVADHDSVGERGARDLAARLMPRVRGVRVITPPDDIKDARAWVLAGATRADVDGVIEQATSQRIAVRVGERQVVR